MEFFVWYFVVYSLYTFLWYKIIFLLSSKNFDFNCKSSMKELRDKYEVCSMDIDLSELALTNANKVKNKIKIDHLYQANWLSLLVNIFIVFNLINLFSGFYHLEF